MLEEEIEKTGSQLQWPCCLHQYSYTSEQGLTLETPEVVPFRLTQNLIDGCGVAGIEGAFRRTAEVTLAVLRQHRATLVCPAINEWLWPSTKMNAHGCAAAVFTCS